MAAKTQVFQVGGMSCSHCVNAVKKAVSALPGVESVDVVLESGKATVTFDPGKVTEADIKHAITEEGYTVE